MFRLLQVRGEHSRLQGRRNQVSNQFCKGSAHRFYHYMSLFASFRASDMVDRPGRATVHVACMARTRRTWCCMSSCNFGTLASFARLPISEVVVRFRMKFGDMLMVNTGTDEVGDGGVMITYKILVVRSELRDIMIVLTDDLNNESDIVSDIGRRAKDGIG